MSEDDERSVDLIIGEIAPYFDENSQTWVALKTMFNSLLADARKRNDSLRNSAEQTAAIRGEVKLLKRLLDLPKTIKGRTERPKITRLSMPGEELY